MRHPEITLDDLAAMLCGSDVNASQRAAHELCRRGSESARQTLAAALRGGPAYARVVSAIALGELDDTRFLPDFAFALTDPTLEEQHAAILHGMTYMDCSAYVPLLCRFIAHGEYVAMVHAVDALMQIDGTVPPADLAEARRLVDEADVSLDWREDGVRHAREELERIGSQLG